jgi:hypothetical protein
MNQTQIVQKINDMNDLIQQVSSSTQNNINLTWTILGVVSTVVIALFGTALFFLVKIMVNDKVNKEIDKRLINLLESNPPIFMASGYELPADNKRIYLSNSIPGIEQLDPDKVILLEADADGLGFSTSNQLFPILRVNENGIVELELLNYTSIQGKVRWRIIWPRIKYAR